MNAPAPRFRAGAGRLCLDFVRTLRHRGTPGETEELPDEAALTAWITQCAPCATFPGPTAAPARRGAVAVQPVPGVEAPAAEGESGVEAPVRHIARARQLREAVHTLLTHARTTGPADCPPAARNLLNDVAAGNPPAPHLNSRGHLHWTAPDPITATLTLIARDALDLATSDLVARLRVCEGHDCQAVFLDLSRPGTRRWCSMSTCGNRAKKQALRDRASR
ncbi:CGNR zinc finger domain-containing protein [Nocardia aurantia]|uniref:CGNR zinc finger domain-containing protein n=1 Tax=Nocardia aurantia TaxID=2585199 RepID=UPI0029E7CB5F|nr:ABATE domain-containing protein [Nocardia aurantia]